VGDASGMFPIDSETGDYDSKMLAQFDEMIADRGYSWNIKDILPKVLSAGEEAGVLTERGAALLDPTGSLQAGIPLCPPEGDAGTGMAYQLFGKHYKDACGNIIPGLEIFNYYTEAFQADRKNRCIRKLIWLQHLPVSRWRWYIVTIAPRTSMHGSTCSVNLRITWDFR